MKEFGLACKNPGFGGGWRCRSCEGGINGWMFLDMERYPENKI